MLLPLAVPRSEGQLETLRVRILAHRPQRTLALAFRRLAVGQVQQPQAGNILGQLVQCRRLPVVVQSAVRDADRHPKTLDRPQVRRRRRSVVSLAECKSDVTEMGGVPDLDTAAPQAESQSGVMGVSLRRRRRLLE